MVKKIFIIFLIMIGSVFIYFTSMDYYRTHSPQKNRERLIFVLNLKSLPISVSDVKCPLSDVITDVVQECFFNINPAEFRFLFKGWEFYPLSSIRSNIYRATPAKFKHGGSILIEPNNARTKIKATYYEE